MDKKERLDIIKPMLISFDIQVKKLKSNYGLLGKDIEYFNLWIDYSRSEGNVKLDIKDDVHISSDFTEQLKTIFSKTFPFPFGMGN